MDPFILLPVGALSFLVLVYLTPIPLALNKKRRQCIQRTMKSMTHILPPLFFSLS